ncbi:MAG TPA: hypothetical protein VKA40_04930 [Nitrososphaera sp.]|nr:hypothetical protein [Nitrososphaera sp.]
MEPAKKGQKPSLKPQPLQGQRIRREKGSTSKGAITPTIATLLHEQNLLIDNKAIVSA